MNHTEKQRIFDEYAKSQGYKDWESIIFEFQICLANHDEFNLHVFSACDLVQKEQQKRIAENALVGYKLDEEMNVSHHVNKSSILSENNLIK